MSDSHARQRYIELSEKCNLCAIRGSCNRPAGMWRYGRRKQCFRTKHPELPAQQHSVTSQKSRILRQNIDSHQLVLGSGNAVTFFRELPVWNHSRNTAFSDWSFSGFIHVLWTNACILPQFRHDHFLWNQFRFIHFQSLFRLNIRVLWDVTTL